MNGYASPIVVKYGGNAMELAGPDPVLEEAAELHRRGVPVVLVHGGGPEIDGWLNRLAIPTSRVDGLRVTSAAALDVTEAVLCGIVNKRLVRACTALSVKAAGVSGEDAGTLVARVARGSKGEDLGFVGEIATSDAGLLKVLLREGYLPIVAPLAATADGSTALNVNGDSAAAAVAAALGARALVLVTNVARVLAEPSDPASGIPRLSLDQARAFANAPACSGGMRPKILAAIEAVAGGAGTAYICKAAPGCIEGALAGDATEIGAC